MRGHLPQAYRRFLAAAPVIAAIFFAGRLSLDRAGWEGRYRAAATIAEVEALCREASNDGACWARLAQSREQWGGESSADWARAVEANPRDALVVTLAALEAEGRGDLKEAERLLLVAERHNRLWLPRWTLANYYFRHGRHEDFWKWVRAALERSHGNLAPVFRMCEEAGGGARFLLGEVLPGNPGVLAGYIEFLAGRGRAADLSVAVEAYLDHLDEQSRGAAWRVVNRAIEAMVKGGEWAASREAWNRMSREGLIPYPALDEDRPLVNGAFREPLEPAGFDWKVGRVEGVESYFGSPPGSVKFVLTGRQPERVVLMAQTVWLKGRQRYRLLYEGRWIGDPGRAHGVKWRAAGLEGGWSFSGDEWVGGSMEIPAAEGRMVEVALVAEREVGRVRPEGELRVRGVRLEAAK